MNERVKWVNRRWQLGWIILIAGLVLGLGGAILPRLVSGLAFNPRLITGLGILLLGVGIAFLVRYGAARQDPQAAARLTIEERDERQQQIRGRAGYRAYWVSAALAYALLMWVSFSSSGSLPELSSDALWYALAVVVLAPFGVYAGSLMYDEGHG